ncbi:MAG TPA: patatin-like phospholipase family protein [Pseudobacteroides sp.]|nr:patatin-like phospholipase family protein [Pseudobacteroides sp.]
MYGLALEGGGAKGAYHMGVIKALLECGYEFGGITGTSIGALNAAVVVQGDFEKGYKLWENLDPTQLFDIKKEDYEKLINREISKEVIKELFFKFKKVIKNKGINRSKMRSIISGIIDEQKLRSSKMDFGLVTVSLSDRKPVEVYKEDIPNGKLVDYLMASSGLPGFKLEEVEGKYYIDGGFYDNCPINLLARKGYKDIIAVKTGAIGLKQKVKYDNINVVEIAPSENLGGIVNFNNNLIRRNLKMGYFDAMKHIKSLHGKKYYIEPVKEDEVFKMLLQMPDELIVQIGDLWGISDVPPKRMLFEKIIPTIATRVKAQSCDTYHDIFLRLAEITAEKLSIDRFRIFSFKDFLMEIKKSSIISEKKNGKFKKIEIINELSKINLLTETGIKIIDFIVNNTD